MLTRLWQSVSLSGLVGPLMPLPATSLGIRVFQSDVIPSTSRLKETSRLSVAQAPGWPRSSSVCQADKAPIPVPTGPETASQPAAAPHTAANSSGAAPSGRLLGSCIEAAADALILNADRLDELDRAVGDGDCGSTLATAARAVKQVLFDKPCLVR